MSDWRQAPRCFAEPSGGLQTGPLMLSPEESRHLCRVRRFGVGEAVTVLDGRGGRGRARICTLSGTRVELEVEAVETLSPPQPHLCLLVGGLKPAAWDELLRHAVELGVNRLIRVQTAHAVAKLDAGDVVRKCARWRGEMVEACKQSGNVWLPELDTAEGVEAAYVRIGTPYRHCLASLDVVAKAPGDLLVSAAERLALWVGPEGDFSADEQQWLLAQGVIPVTLGPRVLRSETAALAWLARLRL